MDFTFRFLGGLARRLPAVAALVKPLLLPLIHHLLRVRSRVSMVDRQEEEANAYLAAMIDSVGSLGVGAKADGRDVLMLVVSDLRIDPRVRSEAMALAEAGYRVTVVCPSPFADTQMPPVIDWGKGVDICYVSVACGNYLSVRPGFEGGLLYDVIAREFADRSFLAVHAHDLNTAYVALAFARLKGAHLVVDFHEWTSENVHWDDIAKSWLFTFAPKGQLDCIDESINTTSYLQMLDKAGHVRFHDVGSIALRGNRFDLMLLHNTATLIDRESVVSYAIDSWFRANGIAPDVVLLDEWIEGWKPSS